MYIYIYWCYIFLSIVCIYKHICLYQFLIDFDTRLYIWNACFYIIGTFCWFIEDSIPPLAPRPLGHHASSSWTCLDSKRTYAPYVCTAKQLACIYSPCEYTHHVYVYLYIYIFIDVIHSWVLYVYKYICFYTYLYVF